MSYCIPNHWRYEPVYGVLQTPDDAYFCAVCGKYINWPAEQIAWDAQEQACHADCLEKEMEGGYGNYGQVGPC